MILNKLNDEQKVAVRQSGNVLLTACPGSGKTRVIIHKLAYELDKLESTSKKRIAAVTFTVRASEEIFKRLNAMGINSDKIWSGTLHAFCLEWILRPYSCYLPELQNGFSIADESYCDELISALKVKYELQPIDPINMRFDRNGNFLEKKTIQKRLLKEYHSILKSKKLIDFELILFHSYRILKNLPRIPEILSKLFKLICIDEYQDTQDLLYAIISTIVKTGNGETSAFFVGDTDQAIYASLGGVAKNIEQIREELNDLPIEPLTLKGNYRSSQRIIDFYRQFQTQPIDIEAVGVNANTKGLITLNKTVDKAKIVEEIAKLIQLSLNNGVPEDEICVLVPQWWLITSISKKLRTLLPNVNFDASGLAPMSRNRENIWYKLSRLFLTEPSPKLYSLRYRWATELIDNFRIHTLTDLDEEYQNARNFLRLINSIKSNETEGIDYLKDCFNQFINIIGIDCTKNSILLESWKLFFANVENRLNDPEFVIPSDIQSFKSFYKEMTGVVINTCVGIKGEEFETVIAYGLLNGYIPHWNEIFSGNANDASKKLLYVICSRAKTNLHLISETGRTTRQGNPLRMTPELEIVKFDYDPV